MSVRLDHRGEWTAHLVGTGDGKLEPPYPLSNCASSICERSLDDYGGDVFLLRDNESGKLVVFCEDCTTYVGLHHALRFTAVTA